MKMAASKNMAGNEKFRGIGHGCWISRLVVAALAMAFVHSQDISHCCEMAVGGCRSVCEKMMPVQKTSDEWIHNIYKFCPPTTIDFWICVNSTTHEFVSGSGWWGLACCELARSPSCRETCATANGAGNLTGVCRRSDELPLFDCVEMQHQSESCCRQTQSIKCHDACQKALWRRDQPTNDSGAVQQAINECDESPELKECLRKMTASTVHPDAYKYIPCCHDSESQACRNSCVEVFSRTGESREIMAALAKHCGSPAIHESLWQCFLRKDDPSDTKDIIPRDVTKVHCCHKATTINCRKLCYNTFYNGLHSYWKTFYTECSQDPQEIALFECLEEVESPCSFGCSGLTYCSQLNNRPTSLFRSCTVEADIEAHMSVAEHKGRGVISISGLDLPVKNSSECPTHIWKGVACALHVKPCTANGGSSLVCLEDCVALVSACVEWARAPAASAHALCAPLAPRRTADPCVPLRRYMAPGTEPPLLTAKEAVTSPCAGSPCNASQVCVINRNCLQGDNCPRYTCVDGCSIDSNSGGSWGTVAVGAWVRVAMSRGAAQACYKLCRCGAGGALGRCQPLPCLTLDTCTLHDTSHQHGEKYYVECNPCTCVVGERVCARRACGAGSAARAPQLTGLPCNCPAHHLPVRAAARLHPNACLAKCAGASDGDIEFGSRAACAGVACARRHACVPAPTVCLSRLQVNCPQHLCVNLSNCNSQPATPVCDTDGVTHASPCHLVLNSRKLAYWGPCLRRCSSRGLVCGVNGVTYSSECAAWAEYVSVDYFGECAGVGPVSDLMEPKCEVDRILCPPLKKLNCLGFTAPGACCPRCGGALRILYSKKQIDRVLYGTNISANVVNLYNILQSLERHINVAECALRGYLTIEMEIFVSVESLLENPTQLQLHMCVLEAEKLADMINRESVFMSSDLGLSALSYALTVHTYPTNGAVSVSISLVAIIFSFFNIYVMR